jgi:hypothetical protein
VGLYLHIGVEGESEIDGADLGRYADFGAFRDFVAKSLENGVPGARFPVLMGHSDCDGEWSVDDCRRLQDELLQIGEAMFAMAALTVNGAWQESVMREKGLVPRNALESFIDVSGVPVAVRLLQLTAVAIDHGYPIAFQ